MLLQSWGLRPNDLSEVWMTSCLTSLFSFTVFTTSMKNIWKNTADNLIQNVVEYYRELAYVLVENAVFRLIRFKGKTSLMFAKLNSVCNTFSHWVCLSCNKRENTSIFPHKNESNSFQLLPHLMQCLYDSYNLKPVFPPLLKTNTLGFWFTYPGISCFQGWQHYFKMLYLECNKRKDCALQDLW